MADEESQLDMMLAQLVLVGSRSWLWSGGSSCALDPTGNDRVGIFQLALLGYSEEMGVETSLTPLAS